MFQLGVPTTRALSLVGTGEPVIRDMFYDGHPRPEPGAIVCRVAPSFVRFGNFQILAANNEMDALKRLADYVMREHFAGLSYELVPGDMPAHCASHGRLDVPGLRARRDVYRQSV